MGAPWSGVEAVVNDRAGDPAVDGVVAVGRLAALLAAVGDSGLPDGLALLVESLGLRSIVLRDVSARGPGPLRAVAGDVVRAVPPRRSVAPAAQGHEAAGPTVELPVVCGGRTVAHLTVVGARPSQLPVLRAAAAVLALALYRDPDALPVGIPAALLGFAEEAADGLADALHDGPVQDLVVARYAADAAERGASASAAREAVQEALVSLRRLLWHVRPRGGDGLVSALDALSSRLSEAGRAALHVTADPHADLLGVSAVAAYRLVQAVALEPSAGAVTVVLRAEGEQSVLEITAGAVPPGTRWEYVAQSLGGSLARSAGGLRLALPRAASILPAARRAGGRSTPSPRGLPADGAEGPPGAGVLAAPHAPRPKATT